MSPPFIQFPSRRSVVHSIKGIVSCTNPLAAQAGLQVLKQGGNAADAAVATAAALNVVDPSMTGIGGDVFCLFYDASSRKVRSLNGSGRSPAGATLQNVCEALGVTGDDLEKAIIPKDSIHAITVPGAAAAWVDTVEQFGSGKVSVGDVLSPAIALAEEGFPVSQIAAEMWALAEEKLKSTKGGCEMLKDDSEAPGGYRAPREGEFFRCIPLASTLRQLAASGKAGFYGGPVAEAIIAETAARGGRLSLDDLEYHARTGSEIGEPMSLRLGQCDATLRDESANTVNALELWEHPPNGQGIVALISFGILQYLEQNSKIPKLAKVGHNSIEYLHALIESLRIAFADASWFVTDPDIPEAKHPEKLISPEYIAERAMLFNPDKASYVIQHGSPSFTPSDTVYLAVTDDDGNGCSFVNSLSDIFGSGIVPAGTGIALQNRGSAFRLHPQHPDVFTPRKRPFNTIIPAIVTNTDDGSLRSVYGVMGGYMQPQGHVQVLLNMEAFGLNPQEALDAPRVCIGAPIPGKSLDPSKAIDMTVYLEEGIDPAVVAGLESMGHEVKVVTGTARSLFGRGQVINTSPDHIAGKRIYSAGSDPRGDGAAVPL